MSVAYISPFRRWFALKVESRPFEPRDCALFDAVHNTPPYVPREIPLLTARFTSNCQDFSNISIHGQGSRFTVLVSILITLDLSLI
jgi:hypothetical protein